MLLWKFRSIISLGVQATSKLIANACAYLLSRHVFKAGSNATDRQEFLQTRHGLIRP